MRHRTCAALASTIFLLAGCGSDSSNSAASSDAGTGTSSSASTAQVRFRYQTDWNTHLGCASLRSYTIEFGAIPVPVDARIDLTAGSVGQYVTVDGRTYKDADVLHRYDCGGSTKEEYGRFGIDLPFAASKRYTVTLSGAAATVAEDP
jgi:hypothetical protein